jgi:hypothetical protein
MLAQIVLTPAESKKLIAKAVARLEAVQQAAKRDCRAPSQQQHLLHRGRNYWVKTENQLLGMWRGDAEGNVCGNGNGPRH